MTARWRAAVEVARAVHLHWTFGSSYSGFTAALSCRGLDLVGVVAARLRSAGEAAGLLGGGRRVFAVDGTRIEAPRTLANERGLGRAGREKTGPQVFLTVLWPLGSGADSKRRHMADMIAGLLSGSMVVADAGFAGYPLCRRLLRAGHSFLIRVGGNITLLEGLGWCVDDHGDSEQGRPPMVLRRITLKATSGDRDGDAEEVHLLTDVLDPSRLDDAEAKRRYRARWGEEVFFRTYKQTMQRRRLLSRTPTTCLLEAAWILIGLWLLALTASRRIAEAGGDPNRLSPARARDVVRRAMRDGRPPRGRRRPSLPREQAECHKDDYTRRNPKAARNYPRRNRKRPEAPQDPHSHRGRNPIDSPLSAAADYMSEDGVAWHPNQSFYGGVERGVSKNPRSEGRPPGDRR
ncbi:transposase [Paludisphaera rhizosphaerae]|uniref:transposase n=1 Tax=Paludisphaera rhizosphaerae TaxID=2711216 RepID=UPI0013EC0C5E|nr:transposase [Paludisphaera rhizosphaerae]